MITESLVIRNTQTKNFFPGFVLLYAVSSKPREGIPCLFATIILYSFHLPITDFR